MLYELKTLDHARRQHYISAEFKKCVTSKEGIGPYVGFCRNLLLCPFL